MKQPLPCKSKQQQYKRLSTNMLGITLKALQQLQKSELACVLMHVQTLWICLTSGQPSCAGTYAEMTMPHQKDCQCCDCPCSTLQQGIIMTGNTLATTQPTSLNGVQDCLTCSLDLRKKNRMYLMKNLRSGTCLDRPVLMRPGCKEKASMLLPCSLYENHIRSQSKYKSDSRCLRAVYS